MPIVKCETCGIEFKKFSSAINRTKSNFCSLDCAGKAKTQQLLVCQNCGKTYIKRKSSALKSKFCSRKCQSKRVKIKEIKYIINEKGCHICISHKPDNDGYIRLFRNKTALYLHRIVYNENHPKEDISDLIIRHTCDNPSCINPKHLLSGTHRDNTNDKVERNRHPKGELCYNAKLSNNDILNIRNDHRTQQIIANEYGVHQSHISAIIKRRKWRNI